MFRASHLGLDINNCSYIVGIKIRSYINLHKKRQQKSWIVPAPSLSTNLYLLNKATNNSNTRAIASSAYKRRLIHYNKLSCRRGTTRRSISVEIL